MDRFKIALKKYPTARIKHRPTKRKGYIKSDLYNFHLFTGPITITDRGGNIITGFIQDIKIEENRPVSIINSFNGPIDFVPGRSETTAEIQLRIDQIIIKDKKIS